MKESYKKNFKNLLKIFPQDLVFGIMNSLARRKYNVKIGKGSKVFLDSFFEGHNAVSNNTEVQGCHIGAFTYIASNCKIGLAKIGRFCALGDNVRTFVGKHPAEKFVSIHPAFYSEKKIVDTTFSDRQLFLEHRFLEGKKYVVEIGNDVWIGNNVIIMDGLKIGNGVIIGAGAVVTKDVPPYAIVGGVPAKLIRYRFSESQIKFLQDFKWWNRDFEWIKNNYESFSDIEGFIKKWN